MSDCLKLKHPFILYYFIFGILHEIFNGVNGLKDVSVKIPPAVTPGDTVTLYCQYDLENEPLYTVKWYKGRQEFFRYIPKELPNTKVFPLPDIPEFTVDTTKSGKNEVVLRNVQLSMAGKYRCEVSADAPLFHTQLVAGYMHVVYLPQGEPKVILEKLRYSAGETLRGNCTAPPALPPANLTWILNGKQVNESFLKRIVIDDDIQQGNVLSDAIDTNYPSYPVSETSSSDTFSISTTISSKAVRKQDTRRQSTIIGIKLELNPDNFLGNRLQLECVGTVLQLYKATTKVIIEEEKPRLASVLSTRDTNSSSCLRCLLQPSLHLLFIYIVLIITNTGTFTR